MDLTNEQVQVLLNLVTREMDGICGDLGYLELSKIRDILEQQLNKMTTDDNRKKVSLGT